MPCPAPSVHRAVSPPPLGGGGPSEGWGRGADRTLPLPATPSRTGPGAALRSRRDVDRRVPDSAPRITSGPVVDAWCWQARSGLSACPLWVGSGHPLLNPSSSDWRHERSLASSREADFPSYRPVPALRITGFLEAKEPLRKPGPPSSDPLSRLKRGPTPLRLPSCEAPVPVASKPRLRRGARGRSRDPPDDKPPQGFAAANRPPPRRSSRSAERGGSCFDLHGPRPRLRGRTRRRDNGHGRPCPSARDRRRSLTYGRAP